MTLRELREHQRDALVRSLAKKYPPRLKRVVLYSGRQGWICYRGDTFSGGRSPEAAYERWIASVHRLLVISNPGMVAQLLTRRTLPLIPHVNA